MKAVQVSKPGGNFEVVERPTPEPGRGQVRRLVADRLRAAGEAVQDEDPDRPAVGGEWLGGGGFGSARPGGPGVR